MSLVGRVAWLALIPLLASPRAHAQACPPVSSAPNPTIQSVPSTTVQTVAASDQAVPLVCSLTIDTAATYDVTLADLGGQLPSSLGGPAPLAYVRLAITDSSGALVGTPLSGVTVGSYTGTGSFSLSAGTYQIHVTGQPGSNAASGPISIVVTPSGAQTPVATFTGALALPPNSVVPSTDAVISDTFPVSTTGTYQLALTDLQVPSALSKAFVALVAEGGAQCGTSIVALVTLPSPPPAGQNNTGTGTATLTAGCTYQVFAVGQASSTAGLYSVVVSPNGGGTPVYIKTVPIGIAAQLGPTQSLSGAYALTLTDLAFPNALQQASVVLVANGLAVAPVAVVPVSGSTHDTVSFPNLPAGSYQIFAVAQPAAAGLGSYAVVLQAQSGSGSTVLSVARTAVTAKSTASGYSYDATLQGAGSYTLDLTDFAFPSQFSSLSAVAVQNGALLGTPLAAAGTQSVNAQAGPVSLLVFATPDQTNGSLFGVDLTASGASSAAIEQTQGVGTVFAATNLSVTTGGSYSVALTDLDFPAQFTTLGIAVTNGVTKVGYIYGSGTLPPFAATPGNYTINVVAVPGGTDKAGLYAMTVASAASPPSVTLSTDQSSVSSGGTVHIIWNSQNASACQASSSPTGGGWSGTITPNANGEATSASLTVSTTFTLTCTNSGGSTTQTAAVTISATSKGGGGALGVGTLALLAGLLTIKMLRDRRSLDPSDPDHA